MKRAISIAVAGVVLGTTPTFAAIGDDEFAKLRADFAAMAQRLNALEAENRALREISDSTVTELEVAKTAVSKVSSRETNSSWADTIELKGDFRYRFENIDVEGTHSRSRNRLRARAELTAKLANNVDVGIGIASGGDDPVSTNQTLGGGESSKGLQLDIAYAKWNVTDSTYVQLGKFKNPLYKPQKGTLLWDGDWRPEGFGAGWSNDKMFATFLGHWLESDSRRSNDVFSWALQGGMKFDLGSAQLTTSLAYHDFPTAGNAAYFDDDFFGNSVVGGVYRYDYQLIELGADLGLSLSDMPLSLFMNYVQNQDADEFDTAWQLGAKLGKASAGNWEVGYRYQDLEADAVLGLLSDSDFAGGGSDGKGHIFSGVYGVSKQWKVAVTWFINNETGGDLNPNGSALDYDRIMIDTAFKF